MNCPFCHQKDTRVVDSRPMFESHAIKRRRKCDSCQRRFTTLEKIHLEKPFVIKNDGRRESYNREKILLGVQKACQKRPLSVMQIERLVDNVERSLFELGDQEIGTRDIGSIVMNHLKELDAVAYVRFASVYRSFKDINEFVSDLNKSFSLEQ
jgi:transcriptional repressor NrdR